MSEQLPAEKVCNHKWKLVTDWIGDQTVINGTQSFTYLECKKCGDMTEDDGSLDDGSDEWDRYEEDGPKDLEDHLEELIKDVP